MMKSLLITAVTLASSAMAATTPPHVGPEGGRFNRLHTLKIEKMIANQLAQKDLSETEAADDKQIEMLLAVGKRASQWIEVVNLSRAPGNKLDLSNPTKTGGIPMSAPQKSSTEIMMSRYEDFLAKTSPLITDVITSSRELPLTPPVSDLEFVTSLRVLDRIYQSTIRWAGARPWISYYINRAIYDVRGFFFLKQTPDLENRLKSFGTLSDADKVKFNGWLFGICRNGDFESSDCKKELSTAIEKERVWDYYNRFSKYGQNMYDLFFTIKKTRSEIKWNEDKSLLIAPFQTPERQDVQEWLKTDVEDEWKTESLKLVINYKTTTDDIPRIQFKEGVTANVNELAGNLITMESEYPINSIDQKWTIRHEYGHVLGFSDCYLEFYDMNEKAMIYYETDVDNLMCSRNGHLKTTHFEQLQKAYK